METAIISTIPTTQEDKRRLRLRAAEAGVSMTEYLRRLIALVERDDVHRDVCRMIEMERAA